MCDVNDHKQADNGDNHGRCIGVNLTKLTQHNAQAGIYASGAGTFYALGGAGPE